MSASGQIIGASQQLLQQIYDVEVTDLAPFLVTDVDRAIELGAHPASRESLLVGDGGGTAFVSLYLDRSLLRNLQRQNPMLELNQHNLDDFCVLLEGVSHFIYLAHNVAHDRPVTQLEMELQAEIDKYIATVTLLRRQYGRAASKSLLRSLFARVRFLPRRDPVRLERYRMANAMAERYCTALHRRYLHRGRRRGLVSELRRFYRLLQPQKLRHIEAHAPA